MSQDEPEVHGIVLGRQPKQKVKCCTVSERKCKWKSRWTRRRARKWRRQTSVTLPTKKLQRVEAAKYKWAKGCADSRKVRQKPKLSGGRGVKIKKLMGANVQVGVAGSKHRKGGSPINRDYENAMLANATRPHL